MAGKFAFNAVEGDEIQRVWLLPAREVDGRSSTCMLIVAELEQPPLVMVHSRIFTPTLRLVTVLFSWLMFVIVPLPIVIDQLPMPTVGVLPVSVVLDELIQSVWLPATVAAVARSSTEILTLETLDGHTPLEIVHSKTFNPVLKLWALLEGEVRLSMFAEPLCTVHKPVPTEGELAASVVFGKVIQRFWAGPATEASGRSSTCMLMVAELEQPPLLMVHSRIFMPMLRLVTVLFSWLIFVTVPLPAIIDQVPMPRVGVLPVNVVLGELMQRV
jgi:hypothetical protein